jgi:hypothetical protein
MLRPDGRKAGKRLKRKVPDKKRSNIEIRQIACQPWIEDGRIALEIRPADKLRRLSPGKLAVFRIGRDAGCFFFEGGNLAGDSAGRRISE